MAGKIESGHNQNQPKEISIFDSLLHLPKGVDPKEFETELLNTYVGSKMSQYFSEHGEPRPEEYEDVTKTLRSVYIGKFAEEKQHWEQKRRQDAPMRRSKKIIPPKPKA